MCARKGFDAVEPDNLAGWEKENHTGFKITTADQLRFNRWVALQVHGRGMSVALKNDGRQAEELINAFDFAVVEQCFQYHECGYYRDSSVTARRSSRPSTNKSRSNIARPRGRSNSVRSTRHTTSSRSPGGPARDLRTVLTPDEALAGEAPDSDREHVRFTAAA